MKCTGKQLVHKENVVVCKSSISSPIDSYKTAQSRMCAFMWYVWLGMASANEILAYNHEAPVLSPGAVLIDKKCKRWPEPQFVHCLMYPDESNGNELHIAWQTGVPYRQLFEPRPLTIVICKHHRSFHVAEMYCGGFSVQSNDGKLFSYPHLLNQLC